MQSCLSPKYFQNLDKKSIINIPQNESRNWSHDMDKLKGSVAISFNSSQQKYRSKSKNRNQTGSI